VTVEELRARLKQGKVYKPEKIEQSLTNFFRKGNLSTLRELALRKVAEEVGAKAAQYRKREVWNLRRSLKKCWSASPRIRQRKNYCAPVHASPDVWAANGLPLLFETPRESAGASNRKRADSLKENLTLAKELGRHSL